MTFRAPITRMSRGIVCGALALGVLWAIHGVAVFAGLDAATRAIPLAVLVVFEVVLLGGLWRLWVVCLITEETGVIVRNFRGDIRVRRREIREVFPVTGFAGCHVAIRLKTGDEIHVDGLAFATAAQTAEVAAQISQALGLVSLPDEP